MRISTAAGVAGVATAALAFSLTGSTAGVAAASQDTAVGLTTTGGMVSFNVNTPSRLTTIGKPVGLDGDTKLFAIDYRPSTGVLYGLGDGGGIYTLVGSKATKVSTLSVELDGQAFDIDFNPVVDRMRVISNTGQNLRVDVATGTATVDGSLNYASQDIAPDVTAAAYTNNDGDPQSGTSLFDIDTNIDQVALQSPANSGSLAFTGKLGMDAGTAAGFDITSDMVDGKAVNNRAYATLSVGGAYGLYRVNPLTGNVTLLGNFPAARQVSNLALSPK